MNYFDIIAPAFIILITLYVFYRVYILYNNVNNQIKKKDSLKNNEAETDHIERTVNKITFIQNDSLKFPDHIRIKGGELINNDLRDLNMLLSEVDPNESLIELDFIENDKLAVIVEGEEEALLEVRFMKNYISYGKQ